MTIFMKVWSILFAVANLVVSIVYMVNDDPSWHSHIVAVFLALAVYTILTELEKK